MKFIETENGLTVAADIPDTITEIVHKAMKQDENNAKVYLCRLVLYAIHNECNKNRHCENCMFCGHYGECDFAEFYLNDKTDLDRLAKRISALPFTEVVI